jgi:hypothetical protein
LFGPGLLQVRTTQVGEVPALGVQVAIGVGPVTVGAGHVVVTQPLTAVGLEGTQAVGIGTFGKLLAKLQVVVVQLFSAVGLAGVQDGTPVGPVTAELHVRVIQFGEVPPEGVHDDTGVFV